MAQKNNWADNWAKSNTSKYFSDPAYRDKIVNQQKQRDGYKQRSWGGSLYDTLDNFGNSVRPLVNWGALVGGVPGAFIIKTANKKNAEQKKKYPGNTAKPPTAADFGGSSSKQYSGPSQRELQRYYDLQARSKYQPRINQLGRQIENANAMGIQSQAAIGGWGRGAGREIAQAGRRNFQDVTGIQNNMADGLAAIGTAAGNLGTPASNRSFLGGAAGAAGLIAGLGAADQGWFNRARDVNAQTTNFYRNNARDQYAQQAYDLQQARNDAAQALADAQMAGATKAKTDYVAMKQQQGSTPQDRADLLTSAKIQARQAIADKTSVAEARGLAVDSVADPQMKAEVYNYITRLYAGPRNSTQWKRVQALRKQAAAGN